MKFYEIEGVFQLIKRYAGFRQLHDKMSEIKAEDFIEKALQRGLLVIYLIHRDGDVEVGQ